MPPLPSLLESSEGPDPIDTVSILLSQLRNPKDVFSILLIIGGDVVARSLAQITGGWLAPPSFSFGWVAYALQSLSSVFGDNKLVPPPDFPVVVVEVSQGHERDNTSWVLGRLLRDYPSWTHKDVKIRTEEMVKTKADYDEKEYNKRLLEEKNEKEEEAKKTNQSQTTDPLIQALPDTPSFPIPFKPSPIAGLCIGIYTQEPLPMDMPHPRNPRPHHLKDSFRWLKEEFIPWLFKGYIPWLYSRSGNPNDWFAYLSSFITVLIQLVFAVIPQILHGRWGVLMITGVGIVLTIISASLRQWRSEKWHARKLPKPKKGKKNKQFLLTSGNGTQHVLFIEGVPGGWDLEDMATGQLNSHTKRVWPTQVLMCILAACWIILLVCATGMQEDGWWLIGVGGVGLVHNIIMAGMSKTPKAAGIPLVYKRVIGHVKVMDALIELERLYPQAGKRLLRIFFPAGPRGNEIELWRRFGECERMEDSARQQVINNIEVWWNGVTNPPAPTTQASSTPNGSSQTPSLAPIQPLNPAAYPQPGPSK